MQPVISYVNVSELLSFYRNVEQFDGITAFGGDTCLVRVLPHGMFLGHYGKGMGCFVLQSVSFFRKFPLIPERFLEEIIDYFRSYPDEEACVRIMYDRKKNEFHLLKADGVRSRTAIWYDFSACMEQVCREQWLTVCEIHSHNTMKAFWSDTDDEDEMETTGIYGVIGRLDRAEPGMRFRVTMDGASGSLNPWDLFDIGKDRLRQSQSGCFYLMEKE